MKKSLYKENGLLSEHGQCVVSPVKTAIFKLLNINEEIKEMGENELRNLGSSLQKIVGDLISDRIQLKNEVARKLAAMKDDEFYAHLKEKYGDNWMLVSLTGEELERCPRLSKEEIDKALEEGRKAAQEYYDNVPMVRVDPGLRFK
jgi:hypothetical protein